MRRRTSLIVAPIALVALAIPSGALAGGTDLKANLTGEQETPTGSGAPNGEGVAKINLKPKRNEVCWKLRFSGIAGKATSSAIFLGSKGEDGPTKVLFFDTKQTSPVSGCTENIAKSKIRKIKQHPRRYHVNVESKKYPDGAIRGQLRRV
jgi:hypothetical protein